MKKEEFPTFLNEQPTVVFGRTTRELLILAIGISSGYLCWQSIHGPAFLGAVGIIVLKGICAAIPIILAIIVAFTKVAMKPLEEWAVIRLSYLVIPKVYIYMPAETEERLLREDGAHEKRQSDAPVNDDDDDLYN